MGSTALPGNAWFYQGKDGLHVLTQYFDKAGKYVCTAQAKLPWKAVTASLSMHRRVQAEREASNRKRRGKQPAGDSQQGAER